MGWGAGLVTAASAQFQASWSCHFPQCIRHKERCWKHGLKTKCCWEMLSLLHTTYIKTLVTHPHKGHKNSPLIKQKSDQDTGENGVHTMQECDRCTWHGEARDQSPLPCALQTLSVLTAVPQLPLKTMPQLSLHHSLFSCFIPDKHFLFLYWLASCCALRYVQCTHEATTSIAKAIDQKSTHEM